MASTVNDIHLIGLAAARPAASASNRGYLYTATDTSGGTTYRSDGSTWTQIAGGVTGGAPSGSAGGDLSGTYPNPTVAKANGNSFPSGVTTGDLIYGSGANALSRLAAGTNTYVLTMSGGLPVWAASAGGAPSGAAGGDLSGTYPNPTVAKANGNSFPSGIATGDLLYGSGANTLSKLAAGTNAYVLTMSGGLPVWAASAGGSPSGSAGGDLSGTYPNPTVAKANGNTFPASIATGDLLYGSGANALSKLPAGTNAYVLTMSGGLPVWAAPAGGTPSGAAGGDLSGTYPNPTVAKANGNTFPASIATGDILYGSGANTLSKLAAGTNGFLLTLSGGVPAWVTPPSAPPNGSAGGDLSGTYPNPTVAKANGNTFPASVSTGDLLYGSGASALSKLAVGSAGQRLKVSSGLPAWATETVTIGGVFDGGGAAVAASTKTAVIRIPYACTITGWYLSGDVSGSAVVDVWKATYATGSVPTVANTITASAKPTITAAFAAASTTLTGWTTSVAANDCIIFNVDSCSTITKLTIELEVTKS